jgi:hypothetical protein
MLLIRDVEMRTARMRETDAEVAILKIKKSVKNYTEFWKCEILEW